MMIAFSKGQRDREREKESIMYGIKIQDPQDWNQDPGSMVTFASDIESAEG